MYTVWIELPLIVTSAPEHWTLPSILSLVISLANISPFLVIILRWKLGERFSEIPFIYSIIVVGIVACFSIGLFWNVTVFIFDKQRSLPLLITVFSLAVLDCTSSLVFYDYMKRFKAKYLQAMFFGEGLTAVIPTFIAIIQGVGGEVQCLQNNQTLTMEPVYSEPRFSVSIFFYLVTGIICISLSAFMILRFTSIIKLANAGHEIIKTNNDETHQTFLTAPENNSQIRKLSLSTPNSMTKQQYYILQIFNIINSTFLFGFLPAIITYALLPYGQKAFYYCSVLYPLAFPLASFCAIFHPTISIFLLVICSIFGSLICSFIIFIAFQSPCPIWADTLHGAIFLISIWFFVSFILTYVRIATGNHIKLAWKKDNGLFYVGVGVQMGIVLGAVPTYLIINVFQLLHDRHPCITYCV